MTLEELDDFLIANDLRATITRNPTRDSTQPCACSIAKAHELSSTPYVFGNGKGSTIERAVRRALAEYDLRRDELRG